MLVLLTGAVDIPRMRTNSVLVMADGNYGSGVQVREGILTAAHVLKQPTNYYYISPKVRNIQGLERTAFLLKVDDELDLALLTNPFLNSNPIKLAKTNPLHGSPIYVVGFGQGKTAAVKKGVVSDIDERIMTDALICFGDSGGGVFNEENELVGIVQSLEVMEFDFTYGRACPVDKISRFLKSK